MINRKQNGFTIVELMISLAVGLVLLAGVLAVFVGMKSTSSETTGYGELQENGRFALTLITDDLLRQNFMGDFSGILDASVLLNSPDPAGVAGNDCIGNGNNASFPVVLGHFRTLWGITTTSANNMNCINDAVVGTDILQLKRAIASPVDVGDMADNRYYIISNKESAAIFPGDIDAVNIPNVNNSQIWEYQHHVYYIRNDIQGTGSNRITVPVLMQGTLFNNNNVMDLEPIVDGIEHIRFMYGVDTDGDNAVNAFISANNMTNSYWDFELDRTILAVKVFVLARGINPDRNYTNNHTYQLGDLPLTFNDNFRRLLFSSTTTLYNGKVDIWQTAE